MRVITTTAEMAAACRECPRPLGLVPTMGALHQGHQALIRRARQENEVLAVSIFVNPAQFGPSEDLQHYPRDLERDLGILREEQADLVFVPPPEEVYPPGFDTWVEPGSLAQRLEGAQRPGHFRGVATVVTKLFSVVRPDRAYFGQKDGQQTVIVRKLARDLDLGPEVVVVPTVRDDDGLACSSRNAYLTPEQRRAAPALYRSLCRARELWRRGVGDGESIRREVRGALEREQEIAAIDYVSVSDPSTLEELETAAPGAMVLAAVRLGNTRLIDNLVLE